MRSCQEKTEPSWQSAFQVVHFHYIFKQCYIKFKHFSCLDSVFLHNQNCMVKKDTIRPERNIQNPVKHLKSWVKTRKLLLIGILTCDKTAWKTQQHVLGMIPINRRFFFGRSVPLKISFFKRQFGLNERNWKDFPRRGYEELAIRKFKYFTVKPLVPGIH